MRTLSIFLFLTGLLFAQFPPSSGSGGGGGGANASVGATGSPVPAAGTLVGAVNPGGNLQALTVDPLGNLKVAGSTMAADCTLSGTLVNNASSTTLDNRPNTTTINGCGYWVLIATKTDGTSATLNIEGASDNAGVPGTFTNSTTTFVSGDSPFFFSAHRSFRRGYAPWIRVTTTSTPVGNVNFYLFGWRTQAEPNLSVYPPTTLNPSFSTFTAGIDSGNQVRPFRVTTQGVPVKTADCQVQGTAFAPGPTTALDNRPAISSLTGGCSRWVMVLNQIGGTASDLQIQGAADNSGTPIGYTNVSFVPVGDSPTVMASSIVTLASNSTQTVQFTSGAPWIRLNMTAQAGFLTYTLYGWRDSARDAQAHTIAGQNDAGSALQTPPVTVSGLDSSGFVRPLSTNTSGAQNTLRAPDCVFTYDVANTGISTNFDNRYTSAGGGCSRWFYQINKAAAGIITTIRIQSAPDNAGTPGSFGTWALTGGAESVFPSGSSSLNAAFSNAQVFSGYGSVFMPWLRVNVSLNTGPTAVSVTLFGYRDSQFPAFPTSTAIQGRDFLSTLRDISVSSSGGLLLAAADNTSQGTISAVDSTSTNLVGANGQTITSGTPSANSFVLMTGSEAPTSRYATLTILATGGFVGNLVVEQLCGTGTNEWTRLDVYQPGVNIASSVLNGPFRGIVSLNSCGDAVRVRAISWTSGTATIQGTFSQLPLSKIYSGGTVRPGSSQATSADDAQVVELRPGGSPANTTDLSNGPVTPGTVATRSALGGCQFNNILPTVGSTQQVATQCDQNGRLLTINADTAIQGQPLQSLLNNNILLPTAGTGLLQFPSVGNAARSISVTVTGSAGITAGQVVFEYSTDGTTITGLNMMETTTIAQQQAPAFTIAAFAVTASTSRTFTGVIPGGVVGIRLRISTAFTGGTVSAWTRVSSGLPLALVPYVNINTGTIATVTTVSTVTSASLSAAATTDIASAAITTTQTSAGIAMANIQSASFSVNVTSVTGTTPTLDVVLQCSINTLDWFDIYHFERITAATSIAVANIEIPCQQIRYVRTVAGTTPSFTMSLTRYSRQIQGERIRRLFNRTIDPNTLNSTTPLIRIEGASQLTAAVSSAAATTACALVVQLSPDNLQWFDFGTPVTVTANSNILILNGPIAAKYVRLRVSTAGTGQTLNYVTISAQ